MARACSVCTHRAHASIDAALVQGVGSNRRVAAQHGLTEQAVRRHATGHLPAKMTQAQEAQELSEADQLLAQVRQRLERAEKHVTLAEGLCGRAASRGDVRGAVAAVQAAVAANRETRACLELQAKLQGQLAEQAAIAAVNVNLTNPYADVSDMDMDQRIDRMLELFARAKERQEAGEIPPGSSARVEEMFGSHDPRAALTHKLDTLAERRNHPELEPELVEELRPRPTLQPPVQPVVPERRNGGWRAI